MKRNDSHTESAPYSYRAIKLDDALYATDLSVQRALDYIPEPAKHNYAIMYQWFIDQTGTIGSRLHGKRLPGVDAGFKHCAQRGIHVPAHQRYAATVTISAGSIYTTDMPPIQLPDGTWTLVYSAHRNNTGGETKATWNDGLYHCLEDGVPVGVFRQVAQGASEYERALAFVEEYLPESDVFILHGPVTAETQGVFASPLKNALAGSSGESPSPEELEQDSRVHAQVTKVLRQGQSVFRQQLLAAYDGQCAVTGCAVPEVLQAAHIIDYRGKTSNVPSNGLLLRADIHALYDSALLTVEPQSKQVLVSSRLGDTEYRQLQDRQIRAASNARVQPDERYLNAQYQKFIQIERTS